MLINSNTVNETTSVRRELLDDWKVLKLLQGFLLAIPSPLAEQMGRRHGHVIDGVSQAKPHEGRYSLFYDVLVDLQHLKLEFSGYREEVYFMRAIKKKGGGGKKCRARNAMDVFGAGRAAYEGCAWLPPLRKVARQEP